ncbi:hypothetical protein GCK32_007661, partial [Trichostrongylus colubriformis]
RIISGLFFQELFVAELAKASYTQAVLEKRKTIQTKDIDRAIASKTNFEFLDGTLTDWPEPESSKGISQTASCTGVEVIAEENVENNEEDAVEESAILEEDEGIVDAEEDVEETTTDSEVAEDANSSNIDMFE